jgi:hypothetical protein
MKITVRQLRRIISEEISSLVEAPGRGSLVAYLVANLQNAVTNRGLDLPVDIFNDLRFRINDESSREDVVRYFGHNALGDIAGRLFDKWYILT